MTEHQHTIIIGAGLAGLAAAYHLQAKGKKVLIIEATDSVGGRIKTELYNGFRLDVGFQVLLTHYPEAQKMLDYDALNLRYFDNGALIFGADTPPYTIADALRQPAALPKMLLSPVGSIIDKLRLAMLVYKLRKQSIDHIFQKNEMPTHQILRKYGFSSKIIQRFFMPFMRGIFLEPKLDTSSRMFDFVFKLFSEGGTALPADGMQAIPLQIAAKLTAGTVIFNEKAMQINAGAVATHTGNIYTADNILIATPATCPLLHDHTPTSQYAHRSVVNVYFAAEKSPLSAPILALNANSNGNFFVENFCVISDIAPNYAPKGQHLVSVSVGGQHHHFTDDELVQRIKTELAPHFGYEVNTWDFIKTYRIQYALPNQTTVRNHADPADIKIGENLYRTGDYLLNGSINAALKAGRQAAEVILNNP